MVRDASKSATSSPWFPRTPPSEISQVPPKVRVDHEPQSNGGEGSHTPTASIDYRKFWIATTLAGLAVICLFVANLSYLYGSTYKQTARSQGLHVLMVDFDGNSAISQAMLGAYQRLSSPSFPTFVLHDTTQVQSPQDAASLVREEKYWAAIYVNPGASQRLSAAISGNSSNYDPDSAMTYVWNQIRYPAISGAVIMPSLLQLVSAAQTAYHMVHAQRDLGVLGTKPYSENAATAIQAFLNPVGAAGINVRAAAQITKNFYNTVSLAVPIVQQFFFIIAFNGISDRFGIFTRSTAKVSGSIRFVVGAIYSCGSALSTTGYIWAFREDWEVPGKAFAETWMLLWLMMHIYYLMLDTATAFLPMPVMPFLVVTFLFLSITSANSPFEVTPGFYRWSQSLPAFETLQMLWNVWSGSFAKVYQAMPILFAWWLTWMVLATLGFIRRRRLAVQGSLCHHSDGSIHH